MGILLPALLQVLPRKIALVLMDLLYCQLQLPGVAPALANITVNALLVKERIYGCRCTGYRKNQYFQIGLYLPGRCNERLSAGEPLFAVIFFKMEVGNEQVIGPARLHG